MAMAIATMQKELSDRAMEKNANAVGNLKIDYEMIQGSATITILAHADALVLPASKVKKNPPKERKYKGMIIKKVEGGWNVEAYDKTLPTLAKAREFISSKVKGSAKPNQRCIRIISGVQCKGTIVKMNKGPHYRCKDCGAKYKAV